MLFQLLDEDRGQDLIEYSLIAALISVMCILVISSLGNTVNQHYETIVTELP